MEIKTIIAVVATLGMLGFPSQCITTTPESVGEDRKQSSMGKLKAVVESGRVARQRGVDTVFFGRGEGKVCATWRYVPKNGGDCECGAAVGNDIICHEGNDSVEVLRCYCITYDNKNHSQVIGGCLYSCFEGGYQSYYKLDQDVCAKYNRAGQLCVSALATLHRQYIHTT